MDTSFDGFKQCSINDTRTPSMVAIVFAISRDVPIRMALVRATGDFIP
jgi:hypothetical protein